MAAHGGFLLHNWPSETSGLLPGVILRTVLFVLDVLLLAALAILATILLTGGGVYHVAAIRVSVRSVGNPLIAAYTLATLRFVLRHRAPFLGLNRLAFSDIESRALRVCVRARLWLARLGAADAARLALVFIALSLVLKVANAYVYFGFYSGDDVEIHEMTFARLFGLEWRAWELRNPFYPMTFIYPVQAALVLFGVVETMPLVFGGRLMVATFATLTLWLLFRVARQHFGTPVAVLAVFLLAFSRLHVAFGSSELPRPVATFFVLGAFSCVLTRQMSAAAVAGVLLGIAASMRFSEIIFLAPALVHTVLTGRVRHAAVFVASFAGAGAAIIGFSDALYWESPFFSLKHVIDYTFIRKLSSRGYEPFYYYAAQIPAWSNFFVVALALFTIRLNLCLALWTWLPLATLSLLPHKEPRYLVPLAPFFALSAAVTLWRLLRDLAGSEDRPPGPRARRYLPIVLLAGAVGALLFEAGGFRFRRSEDGVRLARYLSNRADVQSVAVEQLWRVGGRLYLRDLPTVREIEPERIGDDEYVLSIIRRSDVDWVAIKQQDCERIRCERLLDSASYIEQLLPAGIGVEYRVFKRRAPEVSSGPPGHSESRAVTGSR